MTTNTSSFYRLVLEVKDLCLFSELTELPLKLQLCWVGATYEAVTASAMGLWLVDLLPRLKLVWILFSPWVDTIASSTMFCGVALGQGSSNSGPIVSYTVGVGSSRTLGSPLPGHQVGP